MLAFSFARPVIVPRRGGLAEVGARGCGIAYDPTDGTGLRGALADATRTDATPLGARARRMAKECDWPRIAQAYAAVFGGR
jgi:hypothetical protein